MAKTNSQGFFCDYPCGFKNAKCKNAFSRGCVSAGMRLAPNTEYPHVKRVHVDENGNETLEE